MGRGLFFLFTEVLTVLPDHNSPGLSPSQWLWNGLSVKILCEDEIPPPPLSLCDASVPFISAWQRLAFEIFAAELKKEINCQWFFSPKWKKKKIRHCGCCGVRGCWLAKMDLQIYSLDLNQLLHDSLFFGFDCKNKSVFCSKYVQNKYSQFSRANHLYKCILYYTYYIYYYMYLFYSIK